MNLYRNESSNPKHNAQRNLCGRTHYVDDDTLRFHKSRIISARLAYEGLLFAIVTSDAIDYQNTKRGFRFVIFDVFGTIIERTPLETSYRTSAQATKGMWVAINFIDAKGATLAAIARQEHSHAQEMRQLREELNRPAKQEA